MKRESFRSRLGFLLVSAGCAIGIGNVWRFPYVTGKNGGGYFVLFYILCLLIMGVPVLTMELAVGRASHKSAILAYKTLEKPKSKWHIHGWFCLIGCYLLMMYYTTVCGWMVSDLGGSLSALPRWRSSAATCPMTTPSPVSPSASARSIPSLRSWPARSSSPRASPTA